MSAEASGAAASRHCHSAPSFVLYRPTVLVHVADREVDPTGKGDYQAMSTAFYTNSAPCPFCGHDAYDEETWFNAGCIHLIADWMDEAEDNAGVFGESVCNVEPLPADELARAIQSLNEVVMDKDDARYDGKLAALISVLPRAQTPTWWPALCDAISDQAGEHIGDSNRELGWIPTRIMRGVLFATPGVSIASVIIGGGVISTSNTFVWAENPDAARTMIAERIDAATSTVNQAITLLKQ